MPRKLTTTTKETAMPRKLTTTTKETAMPRKLTTTTKETAMPRKLTTTTKETAMPRKLTTTTKETAMPRKLTTQTPGETQTQDTDDDGQGEGFNPSATVSDPDAAIAAGQAGRARKIEKPRAPLAPADLGPRPDSTRTGAANINAKQQTTTEEAKELDRKGKLQRPVLTEAGWYCPLNSLKERAARKKAGDSEFADIE